MMLYPQSTWMISPVMPELASEARNTPVLPTSLTSTLRCSGALSAHARSISPRPEIPRAARVHEIARQFFGRSVSYAVHQRVQFAVASLQLFKKQRDFFVLRNIAHESFRARQRQNQVFRFHLHPLILIGDGKVSPCRVQS